ncbi:hypothetical protein AWC38_SpisGene16423 [Stylophora pistillata]|uniref:Uncharacterized protein n=1 Tax=Stylophora pistillata TaxID=50429 RepID=A0A2B4RSE4_STYPI|nr:hypothetical protein AWC38_SpisGene16423 [Stylophora pistillata]
MAVGVLIEVFGKIVFSFTRSVMEHYNPEEPAFTIESFGFNPLESTGREWYYPPVGELIYQEYGNEESTSTNYLAARGVHVRVINACSPEEPEELQDDQLEDRSMAWKQLRPSSFQTICKSIVFCVDALYRIMLQAFVKPYYEKYSLKYELSSYVFVAAGPCLQFCYLGRKALRMRSSRETLSLVCKLMTPSFLTYLGGFAVLYFLYPAYLKQRKGSHDRLLIATFAPLIGVAAKVLSRICVQQLWNITHPGYSYVLLVPVYFSAAVVTRLLQAELDGMASIATLGIIHGVIEVVERSTMVVLDHFCHQLWKRTSAPWGSFRTPRRERLMADIAIISMLFESTAIVSDNGFLFLYQLIFLQSDSFVNLLISFISCTSIPLVIEWFFTSVSLAIETRYQNMPVMAVWRRQWKRHILVAFVNMIPLAMWSSGNLFVAVRHYFKEKSL